MCLTIYRKILYPSPFSLQKSYSSDLDILHAVHQISFVIVTYRGVKLDSISLLFVKCQMHYSLIMAEITFSCATYYGFSFAAADDAKKTAIILTQ